MSDAAEPVYGSAGPEQPAVDPAPPASDSPGEYEAYTANYNLLKARKIDEAVAGFKTQVVKFPNGKYTANSYYWLGEIYLLQNNLEEAEAAFSAVTTRFPAHRKSPDAKFKLARVYHLKGDNGKAQSLLTEVAGTNSSAAALARAYLAENF
jgi:tol-pal system protein YbgF